MKRRFFFYIEILGMGQCNLRCPSCATGNSPSVKNVMGLMPPETLDRILEKATSECEVAGVGLFNWAEPLIHPKIAELVRIVHRHGLSCSLSSNMNEIHNLEAVMKENPARFVISVSGFSQPTYALTHRGGDIEAVKRNMQQLSKIVKESGATTDIEVVFHRYKHNLSDERQMKAYAASLGFRFSPVWAFMTPLEKALAVIDPIQNSDLATVTAEDEETIALLAVPIRQAFEVAALHKELPCTLKDDQIVLDCLGNMMTCCAIYDSKKFGLGSYLDNPIGQLQNDKDVSEICTRCMAAGGHVYYTFGAPEFTKMGNNEIFKYEAKYLNETPAYGLGVHEEFSVDLHPIIKGA